MNTIMRDRDVDYSLHLDTEERRSHIGLANNFGVEIMLVLTYKSIYPWTVELNQFNPPRPKYYARDLCV